MNRWQVLVVDDEPEIATHLQRLLETEGFQSQVAHSVKEAQQLLKKNHFDLAVLDIVLPDGNGLDIFRTLRQQNSEVYSIIITGHATLENTIAALNEGVNVYLLKPFQPEQFLAILNQARKTLQLIDENKSLFEEVEWNRWFYDHLVNSSSDAIFVVDQDFSIQFFNRAAAKILETPGDQLTSLPFHRFLEDGFKILKYVFKELNEGKPVSEYRVTLKLANDRTLETNLSASLLRQKGGEIEGMIIYLSNPVIPEEFFQRIVRKEKLATIVELAKALGHEIRNPINILSGRLQLLANELTDTSYQKAIQSIQRQIDRLLQITNVLEDFKFIREDTIPEVFPLGEVLEVAINNRFQKMNQKKITIDLNYQDAGFRVEGNRSQFIIAFQNLLDALAENVSEKSKIKIDCRVNDKINDNKGLELQILVPGVHITREQFFNPYYSSDLQISSLTSLGLTIMQTIFSNFNAEIDAITQNGEGTLIKILFPIAVSDRKNGDPKPRKKSKK